ncbi:glycosyltransferase family 2 protein [Porphyromonas vaginalis]|uniref:glycosyltransferase family 2 protein n=1 Tax=Porphyromonas vaginalis TaxID=3044325 RepID=UPI0026087371|nr:glycosyltransferase family 2 protein [Porphyromonas vaginalis]
MTTTPLLTIITICYNAEATIAPTLRSLAEQSDQSFEYLVIDGDSQDKTLSLVQTLYPRATVYSEPDHGLYDAMNKGLRHATGTYIWYLNAGDTLRTPDTVRTVCAALETHQPDLLYGDTMIVNGTYQDLHPRRLRPPHRLTQRAFANGMLICHQAFIPRRKLAPLYDLRYRYSADYDWCIKIIDAIQSQYRIDDYLVNYLNEGVTTRNHRASLLERLRIMARRYGWFTALTRHVSFLFCRQR